MSVIRITFPTPKPPSLLIFLVLGQKEKSVVRSQAHLTRGIKVLEIAVGAVLHQAKFSLARISVQDVGSDGNL